MSGRVTAQWGLVGKPYATAVADLPRTYEWAMRVDIAPLAHAIGAFADLPLRVCGSGGSLSAATFVAQLHESIGERPATATTPLAIAALGALSRRSGFLLLSDLLFDQAPMSPGSFVYAAERNPFEVYRQIKQAVIQYTDALRPIGDAAVIISVLSSKLMAIGALLATYELFEAGHTVGIAQAEPFGYRLAATGGDSGDTSHHLPRTPSPVFSLWIAGACYRSS